MAKNPIPAATMKQVPAVVDVIQALLEHPEPRPKDFDAIGKLVAKGSDRQRWSLLDASLLTAMTVGQAYTEITGDPGMKVFSKSLLEAFSVEDNPVGANSGQEIPTEIVQGARDVLRYLAANKDTTQISVITPYEENTVPPEQVLGAVTMACHAAGTAVRAISEVTKTPLPDAWGRIKPFLLEA